MKNYVKKLLKKLCWLIIPMAMVGCDLLGGAGGGNGSITVNTVPTGARVMVNGQSQGSSPTEVTGLLPGNHLISISKEGYNDSRQSVSLSSGQRDVVDVSLEPLQGLVLITSEPPQADVQVDGVFKGKTPLLINDFPLGEHNVQVAAEGHNAKQISVTATDRRPQRHQVELDSDSGRVSFSSTPGGATVFIDGRNSGVTPVTVSRIAQGAHEVEYKLEGYQDYRDSLTISSGMVDRMSAVLTPLPGGLSITTIPNGARIYINNEFRGQAPLDITELAVGEYRVRAESEGYEPDARSLTVNNGQVTREEFRFIKNSGSLHIITVPAGVQVFVDGEAAGVTRAGRSNAISEPFEVDLLAQGEHELQLIKKGYTHRGRKFFVQSDKVTALTETLDRMFIPDVRIHMGDSADENIEGVLIEKHRNGDVTIEVGKGIRRTIPRSKIKQIEPLRVGSQLEDR